MNLHAFTCDQTKAPRYRTWRTIQSNFRRYWGLYLLLLPTLIYAAIFLYGPMYGLLIAFKDYNSKLGVLGSLGLYHFINICSAFLPPIIAPN